jgi:hypothetical protein
LESVWKEAAMSACRLHPVIGPEEVSKTSEASVTVAGMPAEIVLSFFLPTPNFGQENYSHDSTVSV